MAAPTTLHKFALLPPELRNSIWESALPPPRVFDVYPASASQKTLAERGLRFANPYSEPPPPLAAVCRESRSLSSYHYRALTLGGTTKYVDLTRDVLLLESCLLERDLLRTLLFMGKIPLIRDNLRSLAFGTSYGVHTGVWHPVLGWKKLTRSNMGRLLQRLGMFEMLERLVFVVKQEVQYEVAELPCARERLHGSHAWSGQVSRNATIYQRGTTPPGPRMLAGSSEPDDGLVSRASTPSASSESSFSSDSEASSCSFYPMPWTDEKPWLSHENEISYFASNPCDPDTEIVAKATVTEESTHLQGPGPTNDDWLRFRRTFKRDLEMGLELGLARPGTSMTASCQKRKRDTGDERNVEFEPRKSKCTRRFDKAMDGYKLPEIQGANLLWRFSLPS
ncbi:hypothetical protein N0V93_001288 [Gnomoniopsis smithogilvyi]|uniref:2EXR domain-containing protein n=1 Tax=Gnomoniopsis smithogilvyi TaxID=1191159 RepID=A0A9W8Z593_9PEZI|nr:hypothetical protein N0V93_001288 [Gnomoniopsis smithogilvyi]